MSAASRSSIVLVGLVVTSAFLFSSRSPSPSKPDALPIAQQIGSISELPRPVKKFPSNARTAEIEIISFEFDRPYLGREGPNERELLDLTEHHYLSLC